MHVILQILIFVSLILGIRGNRFKLNLSEIDQFGNTLDSAICNSLRQIDLFLSPSTIISNCMLDGICQIDNSQLSSLIFRNKSQIKQKYSLDKIYITNQTFLINASSQIVLVFKATFQQVWIIIPISYNQLDLTAHKFVINLQQIKPYPNNTKYSEGRLFPEFIKFITSADLNTTINTFNFLNSLDFGHFFYGYIQSTDKTINYLISQKVYRILNLNNRSSLKGLSGVFEPLNINVKNLKGWDKICYGAKTVTGFFKVNISETYTIWVSWFTVLFYSIYVVFPRFSTTKHCDEKRFYKNSMTCCALYSLFYLQHQVFYTRLSRSVLLMLNFSVYCLVVSIIYKYYFLTSSQSIAIWSAIIAFIVSIPFPYVLGYFFLHQIDKQSLKKYQLQHQEKQHYKKTTKQIYYDLIQTAHQKIQALYFWYYVVVAYLYISFWALAIYLVGHYQQQDLIRVHKMWQFLVIFRTLSVFIAFIIDWIIYDPLMSYFFGTKHFYRIRGFYYQYQIGQFYRLTIKN